MGEFSSAQLFYAGRGSLKRGGIIKRASRRLSGVSASLIRKYFDLAAGRPDVVDLTIGQPSIPPPKHVVDALIRAAAEGKLKYCPNAGIAELREAIAEKYREEYGLDYDPDLEVLVTCGASEAILDVLLALIDEGDEVLVPDPGFVSYVPAVRLAGGKPVLYKLRFEKGFALDPEEIASLVTKRTRAIVINFPSNPTGAVAGERELKALAEIAEEHDLVIISDEVYEKLVYDGARHVCAAQVAPERTLVLNSFSKTYAIPGLRVGYIVGPRELMEPVYLVHAYNTAHAPTPAQYAALAALRGPQDYVEEAAREYARRRDFLYDVLRRVGLECVKPKGAIFLFPRIPKGFRGSVEFANWLLENAGVAVVPGKAFGEYADGFVRMSFAAPMEDLERAAERLEKAAGSWEARLIT